MFLIQHLGLLVFNYGVVIAILYLLGDQLRYDKRMTATLLFLLATGIVIYNALPVHFLLLSLIDGLSATLYCILFTRGNLLGNMTLIGMYLYIMNLSAIIIIGFSYGLYSLAKGQMEWLVIGDEDVVKRILILIAAIVSSGLSILVMKQMKPAVLSLTGWRRSLTFLLCEGMRLIDNVVKCVGGGLGEYHNDPGGIYFLLDSMGAVTFLLSVGILLLHRLLEQRAVRKEMEQQMETALREYGEIAALRQEIRELNHDMRNLRQSPRGQG